MLGQLRPWLQLLRLNLLHQPPVLQGRWLPCRMRCLRLRNTLCRMLRLLRLRR